jgi:hypothetical protein
MSPAFDDSLFDTPPSTGVGYGSLFSAPLLLAVHVSGRFSEGLCMLRKHRELFFV